MNPDRLAELEEERRFLLGSLRDLEREHDAGDVDDADYRTLLDDYTARAADVLRLIEADRDQRAVRPGVGWKRRAVAIGVVVALAAGAGWFVAAQAGERGANQLASGNVDDSSVSSMLSRARSQLGDAAAAAELYSQVLSLEPDNAEALTYLGWLTVISAVQSEQSDPDRLTSGLILLRQATELEPDYADPHCFLAIAFFRFLADAEAASPEIDACIAGRPPAEVAALVQNLADAIAAAG